MAAPSRFWIITNDDLRPAILRQLRSSLQSRSSPSLRDGTRLPPSVWRHFFCCGRIPMRCWGCFVRHVIAEPAEYRATLTRGIEIAAAGENIVVLGIRPTRPETGYGYIEAGAPDTPTSVTQARCACDALPKSRTSKELDSLSRRATISGTAGCFSGAPTRWRMRCVSIFRRPQCCWKGLPPPMARASSRTRSQALSEVRKHQHRLCRSRTPLGQGRSTVAYLLPASDFGWNDLGFLDRAARTSCIKVETSRWEPSLSLRKFRLPREE